jgi:hypothetical protein
MPGEMLSNVIGAPFKQYIIDQLNLRAAMNSGGVTSKRTDEQLLFLANKASWTRLTSSVRVNPRDQNAQKFYANLFDGEVIPGGYTTPDALAKNWILEGGTSQYNNGEYKLRYGFGPDGAYGLGGIQQQGYRPMPGIDSVGIESKGTLGSLREATISFKVWNVVQLNVMEALYFRLGYTMLLEWGHVNYYNNKGQFVTSAEGIDIFNPKLNSKEAVLQLITKKNKESSGNYEAMLGTVTNFYFSFNAEGGFDCNVKLIGLGSVIDTVRINQTFVMPDSLYAKVQQQQALVQQRFEQNQEEALIAKDKEDRVDAGLSPTLIDAVKNADGIKTVYEASKNAKPPANFLSTIEYVSSQYTAIGGGGTYDYYYKATGGTLPKYDQELNDTRTGLFLNTNAKGRTWQLIPASLSSTNPQPVALNAQNLLGLAGRGDSRFIEEVIGEVTVNFNTIDLQRSYSTVNRDADTDLNSVAGNASFYLSLGNTGITDWVQKQNEKVRSSFRAPYPYVILSPSGVPTQKFFSIYYPAKSDSSTQDTTKQVLQALQSWAANPTISIDYVGIISVGSQKSIGYHGTFEAAALDGKKIKFEFASNDTGLIQTVLPRSTTAPPIAASGSVADPQGETEGGENKATSNQIAEPSKFNSALHAMLVAIKAQGLSEALNSNQAVVEINLTENTNIFYQFGVLRNVLNATPTVGTIDQFDITTYAQKGFNSNLMADDSIELSTITNVKFENLCKAYLLKYQFTEGVSTQPNAGEYPVYIKLGYLLAFLNNMCLLYESIDNKSANSGNSLNTIKPYFYIDFHPDYNLCLTAPQHMSVDPTVCLIPLQATNKQYLELFPPDIQALLGTEAFKPETENPFSAFIGSFKTSNAYQGKTMEILLNTQYLLETADRFVSGDKEGAVNLKPFLDRIMEDVTKATGGFNLFRVAYRDDSNTVIIKDDQYTPKLPGEADSVLDRSSYKANRQYMELQVFGSGSLVRDMEFKTNMSSKMSSMIAISAQSGGQTANSQDGTPIGTYNTNYDDAFMAVKLNSLSTGSAITTNTARQQAEEEKKRINTLEEAVKRFNQHVTQVYKNGYVSKIEIPPAVNYYLNRFRILKALDPATTAAPFIPANLSLTMDGISGMLMGNAFTIPEQRLPASLRGADGFTKVGFVVVGLSHTLEGNQWLTKVRGQMIKLRDPVTATSTATVTGVNQSLLPPPGSQVEGTVTTAAGCRTSYPNLTIFETVQVEVFSIRDAAAYLKTNHPDVAKAVFAIIYAEAAKSGADNFRSAGGNNFGGVQTDSGVWGFGNFAGQFCRRDSSGVLRMFAAFSTPQAFLDFMANRIKAKGFASSQTGDQWTDKYINAWWSPVDKASYTKGTATFNSKLAIYKTAEKFYNQA